MGHLVPEVRPSPEDLPRRAGASSLAALVVLPCQDVLLAASLLVACRCSEASPLEEDRLDGVARRAQAALPVEPAAASWPAAVLRAAHPWQVEEAALAVAAWSAVRRRPQEADPWVAACVLVARRLVA